MPGGFPAAEWLNNVKKYRDKDQYYIARYQAWRNRRPCFGKYTHHSCVFGVKDLPALLKRKELIVHKIDLDFQPAAFFCLIEALRNRTTSSPTDFDTEFYSNMPGSRYIRTKDKNNFHFDN